MALGLHGLQHMEISDQSFSSFWIIMTNSPQLPENEEVDAGFGVLIIRKNNSVHAKGVAGAAPVSNHSNLTLLLPCLSTNAGTSSKDQ